MANILPPYVKNLEAIANDAWHGAREKFILKDSKWRKYFMNTFEFLVIISVLYLDDVP